MSASRKRKELSPPKVKPATPLFENSDDEKTTASLSMKEIEEQSLSNKKIFSPNSTVISMLQNFPQHGSTSSVFAQLGTTPQSHSIAYQPPVYTNNTLITDMFAYCDHLSNEIRKEMAQEKLVRTAKGRRGKKFM